MGEVKRVKAFCNSFIELEGKGDDLIVSLCSVVRRMDTLGNNINVRASCKTLFHAFGELFELALVQHSEEVGKIMKALAFIVSEMEDVSRSVEKVVEDAVKGFVVENVGKEMIRAEEVLSVLESVRCIVSQEFALCLMFIL